MDKEELAYRYIRAERTMASIQDAKKLSKEVKVRLISAWAERQSKIESDLFSIFEEEYGKHWHQVATWYEPEEWELKNPDEVQDYMDEYLDECRNDWEYMEETYGEYYEEENPDEA